MKNSPITALIFATLLAGVAVMADAQTPETPATTTARQSDQTELIWLTDLPKALVRAKAEGKSVLLFFHGSLRDREGCWLFKLEDPQGLLKALLLQA